MRQASLSLFVNIFLLLPPYSLHPLIWDPDNLPENRCCPTSFPLKKQTFLLLHIRYFNPSPRWRSLCLFCSLPQSCLLFHMVHKWFILSALAVLLLAAGVFANDGNPCRHISVYDPYLQGQAVFDLSSLIDAYVTHALHASRSNECHVWTFRWM